jgi:hypothetical protein
MAKKTLAKATVVLLVLLNWRVQSQAFQNLDFEATSIQPDPHNQPPFVAPESAFPSWTCYYGTNVAPYAIFNTVTLGAYAVALLGPGLDLPPDIKVLEGEYSAVLQAGLGPPYTPAGILPATIAQSGVVPANARSIQMEVHVFNPSSLAGFTVRLGNQEITMTTLNTTPDYILIGGDISALAGHLGELRISSLPLPSYSNNSIEIDAIQFSPQIVPEPECMLLLVGMVSPFLIRNHRALRESVRPRYVRG